MFFWVLDAVLILPIAQACLQSGQGVHKAEQDLLHANLQQLEATSAQAEEINLSLSKAVKFNWFACSPQELQS